MATIEHTEACRSALASLAHGKSLPHRDLPRGVRSTLKARGLIVLHTHGLVEATPRAWGYCAAPSTFEA